jgi:hypothetical protein
MSNDAAGPPLIRPETIDLGPIQSIDVTQFVTDMLNCSSTTNRLR